MRVNPIDTALAEVRAMTDLPAKAKAAAALIEQCRAGMDHARAIRQQAVKAMHDGGLTYTEIGDLLGVARGRASNIAHGEGKK